MQVACCGNAVTKNEGRAQGYEIPRDFIVEFDPFSKQNHLITASGKPSRSQLKARWDTRPFASIEHLTSLHGGLCHTSTIPILQDMEHWPGAGALTAWHPCRTGALLNGTRTAGGSG